MLYIIRQFHRWYMGMFPKNRPYHIDKYGDKFWTNNHPNFHREDGPAIERSDGAREWYVNGVHHRVNGPAIDSKRIKVWYIKGKIHREDGPAIVHYDRTKQWWYNDKYIVDCKSQEEFERLINLELFW